MLTPTTATAVLPLLLQLLCARGCASSRVEHEPTAAVVTATPWCDNSLRLRLAPDSLPPAVAANKAARGALLRRRGLREMPSALLPEGAAGACAVGAEAPLSPSGASAVRSGNLQAKLLAGGTLELRAVDTGALLFRAQPYFSATTAGPALPDSCAVGPLPRGNDLFEANVTIAAAVANCSATPACSGFTAQASTCADDGAVHKVYFKQGAEVATDDPAWRFWAKPRPVAEGFVYAALNLTAGNAAERVYGLGQGGWTRDNGPCPSGPQAVVPLERNGQVLKLQQRKFHVTIPFALSTAAGGGETYGLLWNMPGAGKVAVGAVGTGGMLWTAEASLGIDVWVTARPSATPAAAAPSAVYAQYADATGHAPPLREDAMLFWQSRNRYKSAAIAMAVAERYAALELPVGVLVIDYKNQHHDGDFAPNSDCFPSVKALSGGVRRALNATTMFSFWPEAVNGSAEFATLLEAGCLINRDLGGLAVDATVPACRAMIWHSFLKPRYYDQGVTSYWLDETDGEGTGIENGDHGYDTSWGPAVAYNNLWVNDWLSVYSEPVAKLGKEPPLVLTRGVWAGGQRHGVVLWSSDIWSTFETLAAMVNQGVHASLSGIPYWTTDVGGYGCGGSHPNHSPYMKELVVRWYQFGTFCPVFRTHGCRSCAEAECQQEPDLAPCVSNAKGRLQGSCAANEVWSYGNDTQSLLEKYIRVRAALKPYIAELAANVSARGVPTMRPLWYEFPEDAKCVGVNDQFLLGPRLLVAPVVTQNATSRTVYFPTGAEWQSFFDPSAAPVKGGSSRVVQAPLDSIPVYWRKELSA